MLRKIRNIYTSYVTRTEGQLNVFMEAPSICGSLSMELASCHRSTILRWLIGFWKILAPLYEVPWFSEWIFSF
jgi:hypothetical protein